MNEFFEKSQLPIKYRLILVFLGFTLFLTWLNPVKIVLFSGIEQYLPAHTLTEIFSVLVSLLAFTVVWENKAEKKYFNSMVVAIIFFVVACIDLAHILSFPGMPDFITPTSANKSIYFWLCGRILLALGMLYLVSSKPQTFQSNLIKYLMLLIAIIFLAVVLWGGLFKLESIPNLFIEGSGLTSVKIGIEAFSVFLLSLSLIVLYFRREVLGSSYDYPNLFMGIIIMMMSEFFFMFFTTHADTTNFFGHLFKVTAYIFFYRALFQESIQRPYVELAKKNYELKEARLAAENSNMAKGQFLANMSHEIRTPMNVIVGVTALVAETKLTDEQKQYIAMLEESGNHLLDVINDILELSKIESSILEINSVEFNLSNAIQSIQQMFKLSAQHRKLELIIHLDSKLPSIVIGDLNKLKRILINLVGNAIKFTEEGKIDISFKLEAQHEEKIKMLVEISDTGIGIPADKMDSLFNYFFQVDDSNTRKYGGSGLGLAISKKLIEAMNGKIWFASELGKGSTFSFTIELMISNKYNQTAI